mgnify:CR=1 FL=1
MRVCREVPPDPAAPDSVPGQEFLPAVDVAFTWYWVRDLNSSTSSGQTYAPAAATEWDDWFALQTAVQGEVFLAYARVGMHRHGLARRFHLVSGCTVVGVCLLRAM